MLVLYFVLSSRHYNDDHEQQKPWMNYFPVSYATISVELLMKQSNSPKQNANKLCNYQHFQTGNRCLDGISWHLCGLLCVCQHKIQSMLTYLELRSINLAFREV